jgi:hypothetical protein
MTEVEGDKAFEARLDRMFADAPALGDSDLFALRVGDKLDRGWTLRGAVIGALGVAGGMVGVFQLVSTGMVARAQALSERSSAALGRELDQILPWHLSFSGLPFAGEVVWMPAALAAVALGYAITRAIREI